MKRDTHKLNEEKRVGDEVHIQKKINLNQSFNLLTSMKLSDLSY